jgi:hypothetical protein
MGKITAHLRWKTGISKGKFSVIEWKFDTFGQAVLKNDTTEDLKVVSSDNKQTMSIQFLHIHQSYHYVGNQIALDGNMKEQLEELHNKSDKLAMMFTQNQAAQDL